MPLYPTAPWKSVIEQSKESYYLSLGRTQGTIRTDAADWNPWCFSCALQSQKQRLERKMEREQVMLATLPELSVLILKLARDHGRVTVAEAARASRNTIKDHLKALAGQGRLTLR